MFRQRGGATLIEVIIAVLIMGISTGAILGAFIVGRYAVERAKHRTVVVNRIAGELEEIMETAYVNVIPSTTTQPVPIDARGTVGTSDDLTGTQTVTVTEMAAGTYGYKKVLVAIGWADVGWGAKSSLSESAITYITQE